MEVGQLLQELVSLLSAGEAEQVSGQPVLAGLPLLLLRLVPNGQHRPLECWTPLIDHKIRDTSLDVRGSDWRTLRHSRLYYTDAEIHHKGDNLLLQEML